MQPTGNKDRDAYVKAWADMMINIWQEKQLVMRTVDTQELYDSLASEVSYQSGGDTVKIDFAFREYGIYVNRGTGKEISRGNSGDLSDIASYDIASGNFRVKREPKPWFTSTFFRSMNALNRDVARIYGEEIAKSIVFTLNKGVL